MTMQIAQTLMDHIHVNAMMDTLAMASAAQVKLLLMTRKPGSMPLKDIATLWLG